MRASFAVRLAVAGVSAASWLAILHSARRSLLFPGTSLLEILLQFPIASVGGRVCDEASRSITCPVRIAAISLAVAGAIVAVAMAGKRRGILFAILSGAVAALLIEIPDLIQFGV